MLWSSSAGEGLATGRSLAQDAPPTVYKQDAESRTTADPGRQCLVTSHRRRNREYKLFSSLRNFRKSLVASYVISNGPILINTQFYNQHVTGPLLTEMHTATSNPAPQLIESPGHLESDLKTFPVAMELAHFTSTPPPGPTHLRQSNAYRKLFRGTASR